MSSTPKAINFEDIFNAALAKYANQTGHDLSNHPLASKIDGCDSAESILAIFQEQAKAFHEFGHGDHKLMKWLQPVVTGLYTLSACPALRDGVSLAFPPVSPIFSAISVLLSTPKSLKASYDALVEILECVESFVGRLMIYTKIDRPTPALTEVLIKILAELISVLALAIKQMNQGRLKKYAKELLGGNEIQSVLQRLDRLTGEESKMTVAQTLEVVCSLVSGMEVVMEGGKASTDDIRQTLVIMQDIAMKVNKMERDKLQDKFRHWLSPPDPWTNHNFAREAHHPGTATWFTQGSAYRQWKSTGSLLWVNGLPGSGKTIISSSIIEDIQTMCLAGLATLVIFYFDFRDIAKQKARNLLSSILVQLCRQSDELSGVLSSTCSTHDDGSREPSMDALLRCLKAMLAHPGQGTLYVILDALDECPNSSGLPTRRQQVLAIVKELIDLKLPHLRFCITSRPEIDIREFFDPLSPYEVTLHDQVGQIKDLAQYVESIVHSDSAMRKWPEEVKNSVIVTLAQNGAGMFRWAYCQLETLRRCPLRKISHALKELPKTLDVTYERILQGIDEEKRDDAHRIFQWLAVASRPLLVKELAEVFAIDFDTETFGIPEFDPSLRDTNAETAVLSTCSTLVSIVGFPGRKIAQFSHFSVKEYLTSDRITNSEHVSRFHVLPKPAHTLLSKACVSVLLQLNHSMDLVKINNFPLAPYAARYWTDHARFEGVSSDIRYGMDCLFDRNKPHLAAWTWLYDVESSQIRPHRSTPSAELGAVPLYYAALCGFHDVAERLLYARPQDVNARSGYPAYRTPLHAAATKEHLNMVRLLLERGADVESRCGQRQTALYMTSSRGNVQVVQLLIDHGADVNVECDDRDDYVDDVKWTPLLVASGTGRPENARILLQHGASVNHQDTEGKSSLHFASRYPSDNLVRLLLDNGADLVALDIWGNTALHEASCHGRVAVVKLLLKYGANMNARSNSGHTPLHDAVRYGHLEVVRLLLDRGADMNAKNKYRWTVLHHAVFNRRTRIAQLLLKRGADPHARTDQGKTPFQLASERDYLDATRLLSEWTGECVEDLEMRDEPTRMWV